MLNTIDIDLSWRADDLNSFLPIILALVFFAIYWFTANSEKIKKYYYKKYTFDKAAFKHIFFTKLFGFLSMGVIPIIICVIFLDSIPFSAYGLTIIPETTLVTLVWIFGLSLLLIPLVYFSAKKPKNLVNYPQIRAKVWTKKMVYLNLLGWFLYLFGYEFLFRGVLLIPVVKALGVWPAIAINVAIYSATHIPKGLDETVGAIPLGLVLCLLTLATGTIWIAFLVHVTMAWTITLTSLKFNPEMKYIK
jgi:membrane protease YdiL (CAAX protease family)|tara:strand:+ start:1598 stop:2341 length:744 start_codon:yes stop_codon:yes gene_type:complete